MFQKNITLWLSFFILYIGAAASAQTESPEWALSERLINSIDFSASIRASFKVSPDGRRVAYGAQAGSKQCVVVDGKEEKQYDAIAVGTLVFSPDSRRVAYEARAGNHWCVVVDGKEEKQYDGIVEGTLVFSPDSRRVAYGARADSRVFVVMDGKEGNHYDAIIALGVKGEGRIVFDSASSLHYLAAKGHSIYLVEEGMK